MLQLMTGLKIKTGKKAGQDIRLGDILKGNQTHEIVVKLRPYKVGMTPDRMFVGKLLKQTTEFDKTFEQDLNEFLTAWTTIEITGNINFAE